MVHELMPHAVGATMTAGGVGECFAEME